MPRGPRDDAPGAVQHVMARGIDRRPIFLDDADREDLVRRLSRLVLELGFRCFAWVLMPNHLHLVVRSGSVGISRLMARLGTGYARYFNERHDRVGHLFQNRFRSRRVRDDVDLMGLVLYVIRNPIEGGLVANPLALEHFAWCGLGALVGRRPPHPFEAVAETLALFDAEPARARRRVRAWLGPRSRSGPGSAPFVPSQTQRAARHPASLGRIEDLLGEVCAGFGVTADELRSRQRRPPLPAARSVLAVRAVEELGVSGAEVARALGVTRAAVSLMLERQRTRGSTT